MCSTNYTHGIIPLKNNRLIQHAMERIFTELSKRRDEIAQLFAYGKELAILMARRITGQKIELDI